MPGKKKAAKHKWGKRKILLACGCVLLALAIVGGFLFWFFTVCQWGLYRPKNPFVQQEGELGFTRGGVVYEYNQDIYNILLLGADTENGDEEDTLAGQADVILLLSVNLENGDATLLQISRDILVPVRQYNAFGEYLFTVDAPLCTAFAYGDGAITSGQMMEQAVSELLYGIPVQRFACVGLDAIPWLADTLGGIPVYEYGDFADVWNLPEDGAALLILGDKAEIYIRGRSLPGMDGTNASRMARIEEFLLSALQLVRENTAANPFYPLRLYRQARSYVDISTDLSVREIAYTANHVLKTSLQRQSVPGETQPMDGDEDEFTFVVDEAALKEYIQDNFFVPA